MTGEVEFSSLTKEDVKIKLEQPDRVPRRPSEKEVAKHRKTRLCLVIFFGIVVLAMVVAAVIIIIVSPKCAEVVNEESDDKEEGSAWWRREVVYQIYPRSFKDSNKDGNGDLKGMIEKMKYIKSLGVKIIRLNSIYDPKDFKAVNTMYNGNMTDFEKLMEKAHELGIKVVLDFVPNHTSDEHPWFKDSKTPNSKKSDWYIWREGRKVMQANKSRLNPPNNWISVYGGSAWERLDGGSHYYLHQFTKEQPDLNLTNPAVISALNDAITFWLGKEIDGLAIENVQYMVEDPLFRNEPKNPNYNSRANSSSNGSDPSPLQYDMLDHMYTHDLDQNQEVLKQFKELVMASKRSSDLVLMAEVTGPSNRTTLYYKVCDFPYNIDLIRTSVTLNKSLSESISQSISGYLKELPKGKWPNWLMGSHNSNRLGKEIIKAMNVLLLTLPGTPSTYYGEEIGMVNAGVGKNAQRSPMQWTKGVGAGFTEGTPWTPVGANSTTVNVDVEEKSKISTLSLYKSLLKLRALDAFDSTDFEVVQVDRQILAYTRGDNAYLVSINLSDQEWDGDLEKLSGRGKIVVDTENKDVGKTEDVNKVTLKPRQALVLELDQKYTHLSS